MTHRPSSDPPLEGLPTDREPAPGTPSAAPSPDEAASGGFGRWSGAFRVLGLGVALGILWLTFRQVDLGQVGSLLGNVGWWLLLVPIPYLFILVFETAGWRLAFTKVGVTPRFLPLLYVRATTEAVAQSLPGGLVFCESLKPYLLGRHCSVAVSEAVAGMAARRYLLLLSQSAYLLLIFVVGYSVLHGHSLRVLGSGGLEWFVLGASVVLGGAAYFLGGSLQRSRVAVAVRSLLHRIPLEALRNALESRRQGFDETDAKLSRFFTGSPLAHVRSGLFFLLGWLAESFEAFLLLRLLGVELDFISVACFEVVVVFARHALFMLPAGMGVQDWGYVTFLAALGVPDALATGAAFSVLKRAKEVLWILVGYGLLLLDGSRPLRAFASGHTRDLPTGATPLAAPAEGFKS